MIKQTLDLNLIPGRVLPRVNVSQYDKGTRTLEFTIYNGEILFDPTGYTAYIQGKKPDGHGFNYAADIANQKISVDVVEQMTAVFGSVACEIVIQDGTDQIGTGNFILQVEAAALPDDATMSESDYNIIQKAVEDAQAAAEEAKEASANAPYIGQNGNWYVYDAESKQFVDTGIEAEGPAGPTGNGISSITKTGTVGLVDTYTITFTDGTTTTFTVTNGEDAVTTVEQDDSLALAPTSAGNALPITIYGQSTQNGTPTPSAPVAIENASADFKCVGKNLIHYPYHHTTKIETGITFTDNGNGTLTVSGTASADTVFVLMLRNTEEGLDIKRGSYILSGCPSGGGDNKYHLYIIDANNTRTLAKDNGNGATFTLSNDEPLCGVLISVKSGTAITTPITFKPILRLASVMDATYEPYKETKVNTNILGANQLPSPYYDGTSKTTLGATFTVESDGSITVTGQPSDTAFFNLTPMEITNQYAGMTLSGAYSGYGKLRARVTDANNTYVREYVDVWNGVVIGSIPDGYKIQFQVIASKSSAPINFKVYPSVRQITVEPLRSIEVTSSDDYNLVKDGKYYIADTIDWDEVDGYKITRRVHEFECDGTENWTFVNTEGQRRFSIRYDTLMNQPIELTGAGSSERSSHFVYKSGNTNPWGGFYLSYIGYLVIHDNDSVIASLADFKTWLGTNKPKFMYAIEPTTEAVSSAQAKALLSMRTYDESTSIDAVNAPAPVLELEYAKTRTPALALTGHNMAHINAIDIGDM